MPDDGGVDDGGPPNRDGGTTSTGGTVGDLDAASRDSGNKSDASDPCADAGPGFADCDGVAANGCETNTLSDPNHCGACGTACHLAAGASACISGSCACGTCAPGYSNCDARCDNGCETHTVSDPFNCNQCGNVCPAMAGSVNCSYLRSCLAGLCNSNTCSAGLADCDCNPANGCETNLANNPGHCGTCEIACDPGKACVAGTCQ